MTAIKQAEAGIFRQISDFEGPKTTATNTLQIWIEVTERQHHYLAADINDGNLRSNRMIFLEVLADAINGDT